MKIRYIYLFFIAWSLFACSPDEMERFDLKTFEVAKIELSADHVQVIADGLSTLTLNPVLYQAYTYQNEAGRDSTVYGKIPVDRIPAGTVSYFLEDGTPLDKPTFQTTDLSKSEVGFYAQVGDLKSNVFKATVRIPLDADAYQTIVYPVVFHIVQEKNKVDLGQGVGDDIILYAFDVINNSFSRNAVFSPNGADSRVRFRLAEFDPYGKRMTVKGINRYPVTREKLSTLNTTTIMEEPEICWDYKRYLNVWVIDDKSNVASCPKYIIEEADLDKIKGINFTKAPMADIDQYKFSLSDIGLMFKAKDFATEDVAYTTQMGKFFGLLETRSKKEDYCDDTFTYSTYREPWNSSSGSNSRLKITPDGLIFYSVNIMDEGTYKNTISMDQVKRIRMVTDHCPHRWAWKSEWAFTGKE